MREKYMKAYMFEMLCKYIARHVARRSGHSRGCQCIKCCRMRVSAKRYARRRLRSGQEGLPSGMSERTGRWCPLGTAGSNRELEAARKAHQHAFYCGESKNKEFYPAEWEYNPWLDALRVRGRHRVFPVSQYL
jgi:hypothetical protein